jgi:membrane-associated phospholipid phosphatase
MRTLIVPLSLITYGFFSQASEDLRDFDVNIKNVVRRDADFHTPIDNYLQYAPGVAVYALNVAGIKGKNNFRDRTMILLLSNAMMGMTVQSIKKITKVERPEGFGKNAFPSGHTATAFAGAEFLRREYREVSPWYGIAGYAVAATTGILRMYNNMHWFRDVMAGAGFGILSTEAAYWLEPIIAKKLFHKRKAYPIYPARY